MSRFLQASGVDAEFEVYRREGMPIVGVTATRNLRLADYAEVARIAGALPPGCVVVHGGCRGGDVALAMFAYAWGCYVHAVIPADHGQLGQGVFRVSHSHEQMPEGTDYRARNERVVALVDRLLVLADQPENGPGSRRSGTWMTKRIAERAGVPVEVQVLHGTVRGA